MPSSGHYNWFESTLSSIENIMHLKYCPKKRDQIYPLKNRFWPMQTGKGNMCFKLKQSSNFKQTSIVTVQNLLEKFETFLTPNRSRFLPLNKELLEVPSALNICHPARQAFSIFHTLPVVRTFFTTSLPFSKKKKNKYCTKFFPRLELSIILEQARHDITFVNNAP
jgi:hypothetical protein